MDYEGKRAECEVEISVVTPKQNELSRETIIINMEELVRSKNKREAASPEGYNNCIPRVRKHIQSNDPSFKETYTPKFVSIGPYFCKDPALQLSNSLKKDYLFNLFKRGREYSELQGVYNDCLESVKQREIEARAYYADKINLNNLKPEEFAAMLVLDGSFILEHVINYNIEFKEEQLWSDQSAPTQLRMDLIMLENQVPFFILEELFKRVEEPEFSDYKDNAKTQFLKSMVLWYLASLDVDVSKMNEKETVFHMLHLVHMYARPQPEKELHRWERFYQKISSTLIDPVCRCAAIEEDEEAYNYPVNTLDKIFDKIRNNLCRILHVRVLLETVLCPLHLIFLLIFGALEQLLFYFVLTPVAHIFWRGEWSSRDSIPNATELQKVMVKVKKQNSGVYEYKVRLHDKTLFMSEVSIDGYAGAFLNNLVALEQALPSKFLPRNFSHYADFMKRLIQTREDVVLLQAEGILESVLHNDDEVISFFNNLVKGHSLIANKNDQIGFVSEQLKKLYENPANIWWGMVMTNYLSSPWTIVALLVAAVQFLQTMLDLRDAEKSKKQ